MGPSTGDRDFGDTDLIKDDHALDRPIYGGDVLYQFSQEHRTADLLTTSLHYVLKPSDIGDSGIITVNFPKRIYASEIQMTKIVFGQGVPWIPKNNPSLYSPVYVYRSRDSLDTVTPSDHKDPVDIYDGRAYQSDTSSTVVTDKPDRLLWSVHDLLERLRQGSFQGGHNSGRLFTYTLLDEFRVRIVPLKLFSVPDCAVWRLFGLYTRTDGTDQTYQADTGAVTVGPIQFHELERAFSIHVVGHSTFFGENVIYETRLKWDQDFTNPSERADLVSLKNQFDLGSFSFKLYDPDMERFYTKDELLLMTTPMSFTLLFRPFYKPLSTRFQ